MYELKVCNNRGEVLDLSTSPDYTVYKITGLNPPNTSISSSSNATSDGITVNGVRVDSRNLVIYLALENDVEWSRVNLYKYFPLKKTVTVYFKNGVREVKINGVVELIECDLFTQREVVQVSLICPQPYFKAVEDLVTEFSEVSALFYFPFSIINDGMEISAITTNIRKSIINTGDIETGCIITFTATGDVVNPVIYDVNTGTHMGFNITLHDTDQLIIDTYTGEKSVQLIRNGVSSNALGNMLPDSSWIKLESGDNVFTYECESGSTDLQIKFSSSVLYGGV